MLKSYHLSQYIKPVVPVYTVLYSNCQFDFHQRKAKINCFLYLKINKIFWLQRIKENMAITFLLTCFLYLFQQHLNVSMPISYNSLFNPCPNIISFTEKLICCQITDYIIKNSFFFLTLNWSIKATTVVLKTLKDC